MYESRGAAMSTYNRKWIQRLLEGGFRWLASGPGGFRKVASLDSAKESSVAGS